MLYFLAYLTGASKMLPQKSAKLSVCIASNCIIMVYNNNYKYEGCNSTCLSSSIKPGYYSAHKHLDARAYTLSCLFTFSFCSCAVIFGFLIAALPNNINPIMRNYFYKIKAGGACYICLTNLTLTCIIYKSLWIVT
jgi:hypothetical protein